MDRFYNSDSITILVTAAICREMSTGNSVSSRNNSPLVRHGSGVKN
jgi:hypothetical protein